MKMTESKMWQYIAKGMKGKWHAQRHEDFSAQGIPDISYGCNGVNGWIELKCVTAKPRNMFKLRTLSVHQQWWLSIRESHGGNCYILVYLVGDWLLFKGKASEALAKGFEASWIESYCVKRWNGEINWDEFAMILSGKIC